MNINNNKETIHIPFGFASDGGGVAVRAAHMMYPNANIDTDMNETEAKIALGATALTGGIIAAPTTTLLSVAGEGLRQGVHYANANNYISKNPKIKSLTNAGADIIGLSLPLYKAKSLIALPLAISAVTTAKDKLNNPNITGDQELQTFVNRYETLNAIQGLLIQGKYYNYLAKAKQATTQLDKLKFLRKAVDTNNKLKPLSNMGIGTDILQLDMGDNNINNLIGCIGQPLWKIGLNNKLKRIPKIGNHLDNIFDLLAFGLNGYDIINNGYDSYNYYLKNK